VRRIAAVLVVALTATGAASGDTFTVVPAAGGVTLPSLAGLPSAELPNAPDSIVLPLNFTQPPAVQEQRTFAQLRGLWQRAGAAYGIPWSVLAAINKVESNFGRNMGPSYAGAIGWMQFMPSTWVRWGTDANADGVADPWNPDDAVFSAARYLAAAGGTQDLYRAVYSYNHADWYVREVLALARLYGQDGAIAFSLDRLQLQLESARRHVVDVNEKLVAELARARRLGRAEQPWRERERTAALLSDRLAAGKQATLVALRRQAVLDRALKLEDNLRSAQTQLARIAAEATPASFAPGADALLQAPSYTGGWVFPVGGGPGTVSVGHTHHDYPAADIAAPAGAPVYALADSIVVRAWHYPDPRCGIGLTLQTGDGQTWTYCHLAYEEPAIGPGTVLTAGQEVGLVGSTGHATGPHLHLQLQPATAYPQEEAWFQSFAGTAFGWQDAPTPLEPEAPVTSVVGFDGPAAPAAAVEAPQGQAAATSAPATPSIGGAVFEVVPRGEDLVLFTR
jgi:murein DD-endopeptidase MepM/ murein hydrolase activator NlpD